MDGSSGVSQHLGPGRAVRDRKNQPETRGNIKTLILESPCPVLKFRAGEIEAGIKEV